MQASDTSEPSASKGSDKSTSDADPSPQRSSIDPAGNRKASHPPRPGGLNSTAGGGGLIGRARIAGLDSAMYQRSAAAAKARSMRPSMETRRKKLDVSVLQVMFQKSMLAH